MEEEIEMIWVLVGVIVLLCGLVALAVHVIKKVGAMAKWYQSRWKASQWTIGQLRWTIDRLLDTDDICGPKEDGDE